jgi:hypothetical protein
MKNNVKFTSIEMKVVINGKEQMVTFEPTVGIDELLGQTVYVLNTAGASAVYVPITGYGVIDGTNEKVKFGLGKSQEFAQMCATANITIINNKEESKMTNNTNNTNTNAQVRMTAEEWTKKLMENAAEFVAKNGGEQAKKLMNEATEENAAENMAQAVAWAGYESGKKEEAKGILASLNPLVNEAKRQGGRFLKWLSGIALLVWRKVSAAIIGLGVFSFHAAGIILNHTIAAGKEIGECFMTDVVERVKKA